jgi:hypothetical protein
MEEDMKNKINKIAFSIFLLIFILITTISFNLEFRKTMIFLYSYHKLILFVNLLFLILSIYFFVFLLTASYYKKIFAILLKSENNLENEAEKLGKALWFVMVLSLYLFLISNTEIAVFSGYKCRENIKGCSVEQGSLRTLYLPDFSASYLKKKEYISEFKEGEIVYFLARTKREDYSSIVYLILLLSPILILRYKR